MDAIAYCFTVLVLAGLGLYATRQWTRETREANDYALWLDDALKREAVLKMQVEEAVNKLNWMDADIDNLCDFIRETSGDAPVVQAYTLDQTYIGRSAWGQWQANKTSDWA